jgi:hypothetical protein
MADFDVDATMDAIAESSTGSTNIPMSAPTPASEPTAQAPQEFEFKWRDRTIKAPLDKLTTWASQGYDYGQRVQELKAERDAFEKQRQGYSRYEEVDAFARENPEWWQHVEQQWEARQQQSQRQAGQESDPVAQMRAEIAELRNFRDEMVSERKNREVQEQDKQLNDEISQIQKQHSSLDWTGVDDEGLTLEMRVLRHAQQNGIHSFRAAFRDFNHDRLIEMSRLDAKEKAIADRKTAAKQGLLGRSNTPVKGLSSAQNIKSKSYNDLMAEGLAELGIN